MTSSELEAIRSKLERSPLLRQDMYDQVVSLLDYVAELEDEIDTLHKALGMIH